MGRIKPKAIFNSCQVLFKEELFSVAIMVLYAAGGIWTCIPSGCSTSWTTTTAKTAYQMRKSFPFRRIVWKVAKIFFGLANFSPQHLFQISRLVFFRFGKFANLTNGLRLRKWLSDEFGIQLIFCFCRETQKSKEVLMNPLFCGAVAGWSKALL